MLGKTGQLVLLIKYEVVIILFLCCRSFNYSLVC